MLLSARLEEQDHQSSVTTPTIKREDTVCISTTTNSPKATQTFLSATGTQPTSSQSSDQSSLLGVPSQETISDDPPPAQSQEDLLGKLKKLVDNGGSTDPELKGVLSELMKAFNKSKTEANQYKIQAQLLSISAKDADMRYEVENELVKREVERLKTQNEQVEYLMNKVMTQKQLVKKYRNEILNKNKEIIRLKNKINAHSSSSKKRRTSNSPTNGMLDTLGMLASQVLTEEEQQPQSTRSFPR